PPLRDVGAEQLHLAGAVLQDEVVGPRLVVAQEEVLDVRSAVTQAEYEVGVPEMGVVTHDVPEQRALPDHRHRLRAAADPVTHPHPEATAEQDDLHNSHPIQTISSAGMGKTSRPPHDRT